MAKEWPDTLCILSAMKKLLNFQERQDHVRFEGYDRETSSCGPQETAVDCGAIFVWSGCFPPHTLGTAMSLWMLRCRGVAPTFVPFDTANILLLARSLSLARCLEAFDSSLPAPISSGIARASLFRCVRMGYGIAGRWSGSKSWSFSSEIRQSWEVLHGLRTL